MLTLILSTHWTNYSLVYFLCFYIPVNIGKLRSDDIEDHAKTVIRLVWDLLESNQQAMKSVLTQELLKMLIGCLPLFKCPVTSVEVRYMS